MMDYVMVVGVEVQVVHAMSLAEMYHLVGMSMDCIVIYVMQYGQTMNIYTIMCV